MDGRAYQRNGIFLSLAIKKFMEDTAPETVLKIKYEGNETLFQIKEKLENTIAENKKIETINKMDKFVNLLGKTPNIILKIAVVLFKTLDRWGLLPRAIIDLSPFHTSAFLTNVGSLGIDAIYHHLYNFGTTSLFFAMGKKKKDIVPGDDEIVEEKCISIAIVGDERICDGYYYANSFKQFLKYLRKPSLLEEKYEPKENNNEETRKEIKEEIK